ncbi:hypothetical protein KBC55_03005 [Patescibacteria group bacterium]|nr:hypothetical protein [Patescibacteria group bacterium]
MQWNRTSVIVGIVAVVAVIFAGIAVWNYTHQDPYKGLVTSIEVQSDPEIVQLMEQRLATTKASIAALEARGEVVDLDLYLSVANDAMVLGDLITAREAIEKQLDGNPLNYTAWNFYGSVLELMTDYEGAEDAYLRAIYSGAAIEEFYRDYIVLLERRYPERTADRFAMLERSVEEQGATQWNMVMLGRYYKDQKDCAAMSAHYDNAERLAPENVEIANEHRDAKGACRE